MTDTFQMPSEAEWDAAGNLGDVTVRQAMAKAITELSRQKAHAAAPLAVGYGALKAVGEYLRVISNPAGAGVLEQNAIAYLRGALREAGGPILDNGQPFTGANDA